MSKFPVTTKGAELLRSELHRLKTVDRPNVITSIAEARAQGDITENAEYEAARERQGFIEGRIIELEAKLGNAQIIDPKLLDDDGRVVFGSTVELMDTETNVSVTYQIVGEDEADIKVNKISYSSPIAKGLIGNLGLSKFSRYTTRIFPICCTASAFSRSQIFSIQSSRASRSSVAARILISSCAFNERSISESTSSVRPLSPMMTTGSSGCA